jgi:hypothetical protein
VETTVAHQEARRGAGSSCAGSDNAAHERSHEPLTMPSSALLCVIRGEFREMPGMRLTREQFRRSWNLTSQECELVLTQLLEDDFLIEARGGRFARKADRVV